MAVKHVVDYYNQVSKDYLDMKSGLQDMEQLYADKMVSPEMVEQMRQMIQPIKSNYETLSYYMFLLNMPNKDSKKKYPRYESQNKKLLRHCKSKGAVLEENQQTLQQLRSTKEEWK